MAANGWNYSWGSFTLLAAPFFTRAFFIDFGIPAGLGFLLGAWRALLRRTGPPEMAVLALAALVQFAFILLVPADLEPRYLVPVYALAAPVAMWGLLGLCRKMLPARPLPAGGLAAALVLISIGQSFRPPHVEPFGTDKAFAAIEPRVNPLILISGSARFEGAMIATIAQADHGRFLYALRASKLLSSSGFMGGGYRPRFATAAEMEHWLLDNRIGWIVADSSAESQAFSHNRMLLDLAARHPKLFRPVWRGMHADGVTQVFEMPAAMVPPRHMETLLALQAPGVIP
jgi:hypothetical protein